MSIIDMSNNVDDYAVLQLFGKIRRQLKLVANQALRPLGIGTKQALILRELRLQKSASPSELSRITDTDPAATGKIIDTLIKRNWVERVDHPEDRRQWRILLTEEGKKI